MQFRVPQFIDIEDRIVGPLTAKQLGWLAAGGVMLLVLWNVLDTAGFYVSVVFVAFIFGSLAFFKPNDQPLPFFIASSIIFLFKPKNYIWKKEADNPNKTKVVAKRKSQSQTIRKSITQEQIQQISKILDKN